MCRVPLYLHVCAPSSVPVVVCMDCRSTPTRSFICESFQVSFTLRFCSLVWWLLGIRALRVIYHVEIGPHSNSGPVLVQKLTKHKHRIFQPRATTMYPANQIHGTIWGPRRDKEYKRGVHVLPFPFPRDCSLSAFATILSTSPPNFHSNGCDLDSDCGPSRQSRKERWCGWGGRLTW